MLSNDIEIVNKAFVDICHPEAVIDAWYRIKTALAVAQKTPTNTARAETVRACSGCKVPNRTIESCFFCFLEKYQRTASPVA